jgi:hypothetical protein
VTEREWAEFLDAHDLAGREEALLSLFFVERSVARGEPVYERDGLLHARKLALVIADELSRLNTPADRGRP